MSGRGICLSDMLHAATAAGRTNVKVNLPYRFYQFGNRQARIPCLKTLMSLKGKDQLQVPAFVTVVQESVIPDLLETCRKHMRQEAADGLPVLQFKTAWAAFSWAGERRGPRSRNSP